MNSYFLAPPLVLTHKSDSDAIQTVIKQLLNALEHGGGLSKEAVDKIKREILGIYDPA